VDDVVGEDPLVLLVPPQFGGVAERDVTHIDQDFVLALAVPDLPACLAGVGQDRADVIAKAATPGVLRSACGREQVAADRGVCEVDRPTSRMSISYEPISANGGQAAITRPVMVGSATATLAARLA
jgi:hypothetical protein